MEAKSLWRRLAAAAAAAAAAVVPGCSFHKPQCELLSRPFALVSPEITWSVEYRRRAGVICESAGAADSHPWARVGSPIVPQMMPAK